MKNLLKVSFWRSCWYHWRLVGCSKKRKETRQHLINELEDYRSLKNQVTNDWDQVQRNLAVVEENVPLATEFSKDLQQEITDFKFQAEPRIAQIKEQIAKITAELPDTQTNKQK